MKNSKSEGQLLSPDFNLDEFTISQAAERFGYNNTPSEEVISNLKELCVHVLQPLRELVKAPVVITSGYRSPTVNAVIGGYYHSQHLEGKAADFLITSLTLPECFNQVYKYLPFDQLIFEFGRWIHVSYNGAANRRQAMISKKVDGKVIYEAVESEIKGK
jgi:zinc D-Ala-D-Ala carboxypeptidase